MSATMDGIHRQWVVVWLHGNGVGRLFTLENNLQAVRTGPLNSRGSGTPYTRAVEWTKF